MINSNPLEIYKMTRISIIFALSKRDRRIMVDLVGPDLSSVHRISLRELADFTLIWT